MKTKLLHLFERLSLQIWFFGGPVVIPPLFGLNPNVYIFYFNASSTVEYRPLARALSPYRAIPCQMSQEKTEGVQKICFQSHTIRYIKRKFLEGFFEFFGINVYLFGPFFKKTLFQQKKSKYFF